MKSKKPSTTSGRQLYALLPELYRTRDMDGQLAAYLDTFGALFDELRNTLDQRLADCFPDNAPYDDERSCQSWLIPYFAKLIDVRLYAPDAEGQREEVSRGVAWRKAKGTVGCIEEIAEAVWHMDIEVQEGWQRVAVTPRVGMPSKSLASIDDTLTLVLQQPSQAARHPALPVATIDTRFVSQAVTAEAGNPAARQTVFGDSAVLWRQNNRHGVPLHAGGFDDVTRRTPDVRQADWRRGHIDARKVLLFAPPPAGFFSPEAVNIAWSDIDDADPSLLQQATEDGVKVYRNISGKQLVITGVRTLENGLAYCLEGVQLNNKLTVPANSRLKLLRVAARNIVVENNATDKPVLDAKDCLFKQIEGVAGTCLLEYCSVLGGVNAEVLLASDCIFAGSVSTGQPGRSCVRYSRVEQEGGFLTVSCTDQPSIFYSATFSNPNIEHGCGVLHPACPPEIRFGAEDGGEMGAFHHRHYCLREQAVADKLMEFLPLGIEPVLIPDSRMSTDPTQ